MGILSSLFGGKKEQLPQRAPTRVAQEVQQLGKERVMQTVQTQQRVLALPEVDMDLEEMRAYAEWVYTQSALICDIRAPRNTQLYLHLKKGGIFYLEPLGVFFFPATFFRKKQGALPPNVRGFWIDASDCPHEAAVKALIQHKVCFMDGSDLMIPSTSEKVSPYKY